MEVVLYLSNVILPLFFIIPEESVVFILKYFLFFVSVAIVVCSEAIQIHVDYTAYAYNTSESGENTSRSIHFLVILNESAMIKDVTSENLVLQWIMLKCVK
jgi:hypothetical protein